MDNEEPKLSKEDIEMNTLLFELKSTPYWNAIKRYKGKVVVLAERSICSADPITQPAAILRNQGIKYGLESFDQYVDSLKDQNEVVDKKGE